MYHKYDSALINSYGLYFDSLLSIIIKNGNHTGIYPDVALLLYKMFMQAGTQGVLEFGSGMSTLILAHAAKKTGGSLVSIENLPKWFDITSKCLDELGLLGYADLVCTQDDVNNCPVLAKYPAVVFVDGIISGKSVGHYGSRLFSCNYYWEQIKDAVLLFDDAQSKTYDLDGWLQDHRPNSTNVLFNPTGRGDRQVLISCTSEHGQYLKVIESCML